MSANEMITTRPNGASVATRGVFGDSLEVRGETAATAVAARATAEVQARYVVAARNPRDVLDVRARVLKHCQRPGFAAKARYRKPVGSSHVEGPSIRFVEAALAEYSNVDTDVIVAYEDAEKIQLRVIVCDLERNITHKAEQVIRKTVERSSVRPGQDVVGQRENTSGRTTYIIRATDEDLANKQAAAASKMLRGLGLKILPADLVDDAMEACMASVRDQASQDPAAARKKIADAFSAINVSPAALAEYLGHPLDQIEPAEIVELRAVYDGIRDGDASWSELLNNRRAERGAPATPGVEPPPPAKGVAGVKARVARRTTPGTVAAGHVEPEPAPVVDRDTKPANPATDLSKPYPIAQREADDTVRTHRDPPRTPAESLTRAAEGAGRDFTIHPPLDELAATIADLEHRLARVGLTNDAAAIFDRIRALPPGADRERLERLGIAAIEGADPVTGEVAP